MKTSENLQQCPAGGFFVWDPVTVASRRPNRWSGNGARLRSRVQADESAFDDSQQAIQECPQQRPQSAPATGTDRRALNAVLAAEKWCIGWSE
jgi:hypothetical protein